MEQQIIDKLQKDAEQEIGLMPTKRGEIPSLELLCKFYRFYITKEPLNLDSVENIFLIKLCSNSRQHVLKVVKMHYNLDFINFMTKFHDWNRINNPEEY